MNKNLVFAAGAALMCLGAFDLYVGLTHPGVGEDAFTAVAQSFMLLFPGSVFMAYSLQKTPRLTSLGAAAPRPVLAEATEDVLKSVAADGVVVPFPRRGGRGSGGKAAFRAHSK